MEIKTLGIVGAGIMGSGIAQAAVQNGLEASLYDISETVLSRADERILKGLERAERPGAFSLLRKTTRLEALVHCDLIIEAMREDLEIKQDVFRKLDHLIEPPRILATNTASLSVTRIAAATENPQRVAGLHFFNPAHVTRLVEVVRGEKTADGVVVQLSDFARMLEKTPVACKDSPGYVVNRISASFYVAGLRLLESGAGTPAAIDQAMREGGFLKGPLELADMRGLHSHLLFLRWMDQALGNPERLKPSDVLALLVARGCRGRKNSRGFYLYDEREPGIFNPLLEEFVPKLAAHPMKPRDMFRTTLNAVIEEAGFAVKEGVATQEDIDMAMRLGASWPKGPFEWEQSLRGH